MGDHVKVTPDLLRKTGNAIVDTADRLHGNVEELEGAREADARANANFAATRALVDCQLGWEHTLKVFGGTLAVAGDNVVLSANTYRQTDAANAATLRPR